jgi:dipeptidyl-peptidase-4
MVRRLSALAAACLVTLPAIAQQVSTAPPREKSLRELTIESLFDPKARVAFSGAPQSGFVWIDDHTVTWPRTDTRGKVVEQVVLDTDSGKTRTLFNSDKFQAALRKAGATEEEAKTTALQKSWNFSTNRRSVLLNLADDLYVYAIDTDTLTRLTSTPAAEEEASFSPDGRMVAFVRANNLFVVDLATQRERQLTTDGTDNILNGIFDWVYQEEIYGRDNFHGYWWSPDSSRLAFIQIDERPVKPFTVVDHIPYQQNLEVTAYPKAGAPNPIARLFTVSPNGGAPKPVELGPYGGETLLVDVNWAPDGKRLLFQVQNRIQTWLDLNASDVAANETKTLLRETTKAWVDNNGSPVWLKDGSFLWLSDRAGFKHLFHYSADGKLLGQITDGKWEVRTLHGVDAANDWIYFSGTERSPIGGDVYRVKLDGSGLKRLSDAAGTHVATFNPALSLYVDSWSDVQTPAQVYLHRNDGNRLRVVDANDVPLLREYRSSKPELVQVKTRDGFVMEALLIKPPDFDPSKRYPVYEHTYSGPHAQQVKNSWSRDYPFHQYLASRGIIVWICDNRTASGKGAESMWPVYKNFGELELRDLEDGLKWLESNSWVDSSRVLLNGWSYGGFMTSYALTHSTMWSAGIAGGTVADWRDYDTIYTERYMQTPQENPEGYKKSSPRFAAKDLHGNLLLLHGTIDDNVHMQNTIQFIYELEKAGKPYDLAVYPKSRHGVVDPALNLHLRQRMVRFIEANLLAK